MLQWDHKFYLEEFTKLKNRVYRITYSTIQGNKVIEPFEQQNKRLNR